MPRSFSEEVYTKILDGDTVKLSGVETKKDFESIRTNLYRNHKLMVEIGGTTLSIIASYSSESQEALFRLGTPKRALQKTYIIEIVDDS